jgi:hypothetical protein
MVLSEGGLIGLPGIARPHAVCPTRVDHAEPAKLFRSLGSVARADIPEPAQQQGTRQMQSNAPTPTPATGRPFGLQAAQNAACPGHRIPSEPTLFGDAKFFGGPVDDLMRIVSARGVDLDDLARDDIADWVVAIN